MRAAALTGCIGTGKSTVLGFFSQLGAETIDSDKIVSLLYKKAKVKSFLKKKFGSTRKKKISEKVFFNSKKLFLLENFLHPLVLEAVASKLKRLSFSKKPVVVELPVFFESHLHSEFSKLFSKTIVVTATQAQQVYRLQQQGYSISNAFARIKAQIPLEKKIKKADFIIDNSSSLKETKKQVKKIFKKLN